MKAHTHMSPFSSCLLSRNYLFRLDLSNMSLIQVGFTVGGLGHVFHVFAVI